MRLFTELFTPKSQIWDKSLLIYIKSGLWSAKSDHFWTFLPNTVIFWTVWKNYFGTIWEHWEETLLPVVILTFSRNDRLFNPSFTFSHHFFQFLWNTEFWVQKQTNFGPFSFKNWDFKQEFALFRLFWNTGKRPWF